MSTVLAQSSEPVIDACGVDGTYTCKKVFEWTDNELAATAADWLLDRPVRIALIVLLAIVASKVLQRAVARFVNTVAATPNEIRLKALGDRATERVLVEKESKRAEARAETIGLVLRSIVVAVVWTFAAMMILGQLAIDLGYATGTVEKVSLRSTTIRDVNGTVWHVPNGEIARVGNYSQLWSRALLDIEVAYDVDLRFAQGVIQRVADEFWEDPEWGGDELMERPEVWGIQALGASGIAIRLAVKTEPSMQWATERELRLRVKEALDEAGIEIPFPQQTVWLRNQGEHLIAAAPDQAEIATHKVAGGGGSDAVE